MGYYFVTSWLFNFIGFFLATQVNSKTTKNKAEEAGEDYKEVDLDSGELNKDDFNQTKVVPAYSLPTLK